MIFMIRVISSRSSLTKRGLSLSGPAALLGFRFLRSFNSPFCEILISGIVVTEPCNVSGMVSECRPPALFKSSPFKQMVHRIYPAELQLNKANASNTEAVFF